VLQVSKIAAFDKSYHDESYQGFVDELKKNRIVKGQNITINRHVIDTGAAAGLWIKTRILMKIKSTASEIVASKSNLVLTISSPAAKFSMDKILQVAKYFNKTKYGSSQ
jgi:putative tryptophan/tyrosine transport system substrate-binding protein